MKHLLKFIPALLAIILLSPIRSDAEVPGKSYQPGDTIVLDGLYCMVFKVDDSGMHGTALATRAQSEKERLKYHNSMKKYLEMQIKKGKATQGDLDTYLENTEKAVVIPVVNVEKTKNGKIFKVDEWYQEAPKGWRIPTSKDAEDFATFFLGGLGKDYGCFAITSKTSKLTTDIMSQANLILITSNGMILSDSDKPEDVKFLRTMSVKGFKPKDWLEIQNKYGGKEYTVAVKDF